MNGNWKRFLWRKPCVCIILAVFILVLFVYGCKKVREADDANALFQSESEMIEYWERMGYTDILCTKLLDKDFEDFEIGGDADGHSCSLSIHDNIGDAGRNRKLIVLSNRTTGRIRGIGMNNIPRIRAIPDSKCLFSSENNMKEHWKKIGLGNLSDSSCITKGTDGVTTTRECELTFAKWLNYGEKHPVSITSISRTGQIVNIGVDGVDRNLPPGMALRARDVYSGFMFMKDISNIEDDLRESCMIILNGTPVSLAQVDGRGGFHATCSCHESKTAIQIQLADLPYAKKINYSVKSDYDYGDIIDDRPLSQDNMLPYLKELAIISHRRDAVKLMQCMSSSANDLACKDDWDSTRFVAVSNSSGKVTYFMVVGSGKPDKPKETPEKISSFFPSENSVMAHFKEGWAQYISGCSPMGSSDKEYSKVACEFKIPDEKDSQAYVNTFGDGAYSSERWRPDETKFKLVMSMTGDGQVKKISLEDVPYNKKGDIKVSAYFFMLAQLSGRGYDAEECDDSYDKWWRSDKRTGLLRCDASSGVTFSKIVSLDGKTVSYTASITP